MRGFWAKEPEEELIYCPIPRCMPEYMACGLAAAVGVGILLAGDERLGVDLIYRLGYSLETIRWLWGGAFLGSAIMRFIALRYGGFATQRWTAFICFLSWLTLLCVSINHQMRSIAAPVAIWGVVVEVIIFSLLRGGRWKRSSTHS
jgi:hypothetical protein